MKKKFIWLLAFVLVFASVFFLPNEKIAARADGGVTLKIHFHKADGDYGPWSLWLWEAGKDGADYAFNDENGEKVVTMPVTPGTQSVGFIVRTQAWDKDVADDQFIDISELLSGTVHIYIESKVPGYTKTYGDDAVCGVNLKKAVYDGDKTITVTMTGEIEGNLKDALVFASDAASVTDITYQGNNVYVISLSGELNVFKSFYIKYDGQEYKVNMPNVYSTEDFEAKYTYSGNDLGATWTKEQTTFRVWAPTAEAVSVCLYEKGDARIETMKDEVSMKADVNGTWVVTIPGDLNGTYYTYKVFFEGKGTEACDPYARTTGVNGDRAMVIDLASTNPEGWDKDTNPHAGEPYNDAIIYEAHVRDLTTEAGAGIKNVGKFLGVVETGTKTKDGVSTGLDHIKELGVTHLHLLPVYDFGSVNELGGKYAAGYNWGYDPVNYNVPEGSYATDPENGAVRVCEFKTMVKGLHDNGISVVMDVVYNHVQSAGDFCFNKLVPGYFSRIGEDGSYSNGSGCGNDTASERSMVKKYIVESVCYWASEYHIDGFRFDLVGLLDVDTVNAIVEEVHKINPDVLFYGEGWSLTTATTKPGTVLATMFNSDKVNDFAFFNDTFRDGLKGSVFNTGKGFVSGATGEEAKIARCFIGLDTWCQNPSQTINYASCHDNNTLFDRLNISCKDASREDLIKMNNLAASLYLTAEGIPFMQAGEEMLRSKVNSDGTFNENSYSAGDAVNSMIYSALSEKDTKAVFEYYKGLIAFRKAHKALRLSTADEVLQYVSEVTMPEENMVGFEISGDMEGESADRIFLAFNANPENVTIDLPEGEWNVCVNDEKAGVKSLKKVSGEVTVKGISAMVLVQGNVASGSSLNGGLIAAVVGAVAVIGAAIAVIFTRRKK